MAHIAVQPLLGGLILTDTNRQRSHVVLQIDRNRTYPLDHDATLKLNATEIEALILALQSQLHDLKPDRPIWLE